jgi:phosphopantetheinyl transferase
MPLLQSLSVKSGKILIWNIIPEETFARYAHITHTNAKKQLEKRAIYALCHQELGADFQGIEYLDSGKPYIQGVQGFSLSHCYPYCAIFISTKIAEIGIDIENPAQKLHDVRTKFLSYKELTKLPMELSYLQAYWCAKEAVYKSLSYQANIYLLDIYISSVRKLKTGFSLLLLVQGKTIQVKTFLLPNGTLCAYTLDA